MVFKADSRSCAITTSPDIIGTSDLEGIIDHKTSTLILYLVTDLRHHGFDERTRCVSGSPNEKTVWDAGKGETNRVSMLGIEWPNLIERKRTR